MASGPCPVLPEPPVPAVTLEPDIGESRMVRLPPLAT
jgi:hypothetical protein